MSRWARLGGKGRVVTACRFKDELMSGESLSYRGAGVGAGVDDELRAVCQAANQRRAWSRTDELRGGGSVHVIGRGCGTYYSVFFASVYTGKQVLLVPWSITIHASSECRYDLTGYAGASCRYSGVSCRHLACPGRIAVLSDIRTRDYGGLTRRGRSSGLDDYALARYADHPSRVQGQLLHLAKLVLVWPQSWWLCILRNKRTRLHEVHGVRRQAQGGRGHDGHLSYRLHSRPAARRHKRGAMHPLTAASVEKGSWLLRQDGRRDGRAETGRGSASRLACSSLVAAGRENWAAAGRSEVQSCTHGSHA